MSTWLLKATCNSSPWLPRMKVGQLCLLWNCLDKVDTWAGKEEWWCQWRVFDAKIPHNAVCCLLTPPARLSSSSSPASQKCTFKVALIWFWNCKKNSFKVVIWFNLKIHSILHCNWGCDSKSLGKILFQHFMKVSCRNKAWIIVTSVSCLHHCSSTFTLERRE